VNRERDMGKESVEQELLSIMSWQDLLLSLRNRRRDTVGSFSSDLAAAYRGLAAAADRLALCALRQAMAYQRESEIVAENKQCADAIVGDEKRGEQK
jgi:hypothetical protein